MEKQMLTAHIECNNTGFYTVYCEEDFPFGFFGEGFSADEARVDFVECFKAMRDDYFEQTGNSWTRSSLSFMTLPPSCSIIKAS